MDGYALSAPRLEAILYRSGGGGCLTTRRSDTSLELQGGSWLIYPFHFLTVAYEVYRVSLRYILIEKYHYFTYRYSCLPNHRLLLRRGVTFPSISMHFCTYSPLCLAQNKTALRKSARYRIERCRAVDSRR